MTTRVGLLVQRGHAEVLLPQAGSNIVWIQPLPAWPLLPLSQIHEVTSGRTISLSMTLLIRALENILPGILRKVRNIFGGMN
jgi:hypothetical protein